MRIRCPERMTGRSSSRAFERTSVAAAGVERVRIIHEFPREESADRLVSVSGSARDEIQIHRLKSAHCAETNSAADHGSHVEVREEPCHGSVSGSRGRHFLHLNHFAVLHVIDAESRSVTEVLVDFAVFNRNCNTHCLISLLEGPGKSSRIHPFPEGSDGSIQVPRTRAGDQLGNFPVRSLSISGNNDYRKRGFRKSLRKLHPLLQKTLNHNKNESPGSGPLSGPESGSSEHNRYRRRAGGQTDRARCHLIMPLRTYPYAFR